MKRSFLKEVRRQIYQYVVKENAYLNAGDAIMRLYEKSQPQLITTGFSMFSIN